MSSLPRLFIDTLELTIPVDEDRKQVVQERLDDASEHWPDSLISLPARRPYARRYQLDIPGGGTITVKAAPENQASNYLKLEYKPEQIGIEGARTLAQYLRFVLGETYREDFYQGNVNRLDATFDIHRVSIENFWVEDSRERMKSALIRGKFQRIETIYLGYKSGRQLYVYDKKAETKERGRDVSISTPWVRFEYRYVKGDYPLGDLYGRMGNPYDKFVIKRYAPIPHLMEDHHSRWLFDACRLRGGAQVLGAMPEHLRSDAETAMRAFPLASCWLRRRAIWFQLRDRIEELLSYI